MIWASFLLAMAGWVGGAAAWIAFGKPAGIDPLFIAALSVGITFTITCCQSIVMPDKAKIYGLGHRDGYAAAVAQYAPEGEPERARPLSIVRH